MNSYTPPDTCPAQSSVEQVSEYLSKSKKYKGFHYSVLSPDMIEYLHRTTLEITKLVVRIFDENNINYMICGGTLLGAVTTGKFIPWDDDVDICVLEQDYDRMKKVLISKLPNWIEVQCYETEPNYFHGWVKVRDKKSIIYPNESNYKCNGVWLDLYKLTLTKQSKVPYLITKEHLEYLNRRYATGCISAEERDRRISDNKLEEKLINAKKLIISEEIDSDVYIVWSASKILVEKEWCLPYNIYKFEGINLKSFNNPDAYLKRHYGDSYMKLPPEEARRVGINKIEYL